MVIATKYCVAMKILAEVHTWASKRPILGFRGGNTVHKGILEFVLYYIRFDPPTPTYAEVAFQGGHTFVQLYAGLSHI